MIPLRRAGAVLVSIAILGACGGGETTPDGSTTAADSEAPTSAVAASDPPGTVASPPGDLGDLAWIFDQGTPSADLTISLDTAAQVETIVPVTGGRVTATGVDGTVYDLEIPAGALVEDTAIGLTPVATIAGLPWGGADTFAVQLSPDGLALYAPAILTIKPSTPIPPAEQIPFDYVGDGKDVILGLPLRTDPAMRIEIPHFSGHGITRGILAETATERQRHGATTERRLADALHAQVILIRQAGGEWTGVQTAAAFDEIFREYEVSVVAGRVAAAGDSCAAGRLALETLIGLDRQRHLVGLGADGTVFADHPGLLERVTRVCMREEFELCVEDHVIHRIAWVWRSFERQYELLGARTDLDEGPLREARELTVQCLTFELRLESTATLDAAEGGYESTVRSEVKLRFDPEETRISGTAALDNTAFTFNAPCGARGVTGGGTFEVAQLRIMTAQPDDSSGSYRTDDGKDLDFLMSYLPGPTSESAKVTICGSTGGPLPLPPFPAWTSAFIATHQAELDAVGRLGGGYIAIDWEVFGDAYFAKKEWIKEFGSIVEVGTFKLYHTPGA